MGQKESKDRLSKQDLDFLKTSTRFDEDTIIEWYRGFKSDCPDGRLTPKGPFILLCQMISVECPTNFKFGATFSIVVHALA